MWLMPAKSLTPGMCNFPVNMTEAERSFWGRLGFSHDRSAGAEIRRLALIGLRTEDPEAAAKIEEIRRTRKQIISGAVCALALLVSVAESFVDGDGSRFRKASRSVKVRTVLKNGLEMEVA